MDHFTMHDSVFLTTLSTYYRYEIPPATLPDTPATYRLTRSIAAMIENSNGTGITNIDE
jgi:hypothetical protein